MSLLYSPSKKGFTLVELLVVITIIAVLSLIGITLYSSVQKSSRDARRKADVDAIANAFEANYNSTSPNCGTGPYCNIDVGGGEHGDWLFVGGVPKNPTPGGADYTIAYPTDSPDSGTVWKMTAYVVCAKLENNDTGNSVDVGSCIYADGTCDFTLTSATLKKDYYCRKNQQ